MALTPEAKKLLGETIRGTAQNPARGLRERVLRTVAEEADRRYRLSLPLKDAGLDETHRRRRERIDSWLDERSRAAKAKTKAEQQALRERAFGQAIKEAGATLINRLVLLRQLEAFGLSRPHVLTGGWRSKGYREFHEFGRTLCVNGTTDPSEGYETLLQLVFDELAIDLPGLFGDVGLTRLLPIPPATLREVVEAFDQPALASAWTDDTTLGWVYQYWNDPDREALDDKIAGGGKIEPHEIASKTQMFTERYMVEWLVQNSLGLTWLCMCKRQGWTADAEAVLPVLEGRRAGWRQRREAGDVPLDALMPIEGELEEAWKYFVPQPLPGEAVARAPASVRELKVLDPAVGSGHFLVIAFGFLASLYREEARHRGQTISDREIAESIIENNLHGIDIDPRAIQIAAAALYLRMKRAARDAHPRRMNLVAPTLQLGKLPKDDAAVVALRADLKREVGVPEELTDRLLSALAGVDHLGSLLKVDAAVDQAIAEVELAFEKTHGQGSLFGGFPVRQVKLTAPEAKATILDKIELFLARHSTSEDLGLRLDGEQLAAGVRFVRLAKEGAYDVVVGNPPYQGLSKTASFGYVAATYPRGKADLYAAFLERGLELVREGGLSALLTMRGWMFQGQFAELRKAVLHEHNLQNLGDFDRGAFDEVPNEVLAVAAPVIRRGGAPQGVSVALLPTPSHEKAYDRERTARKRAAVLAQVGRHDFDPRAFSVIEGEPIVYWWTKDFLARYAAAPKLGDRSPGRFGLTTGDNSRFTRLWFEVRAEQCERWPVANAVESDLAAPIDREWVPFVLGGKGRAWIEPLHDFCRWMANGLEVKEKCVSQYGTVSKQIRNDSFYFRPGIAFAMIGSEFSGRMHRYPSVIGNMGSSIFPPQEVFEDLLISMNSAVAQHVLQSLNPGLHFEVGDVNRLPLLPVRDARGVLSRTDTAFSEHEAHREASVEFRGPGLSQWRHAQAWAQQAVDRPEGTPLPPYTPEYDPPEPSAFVSFAIGVALGRFGAHGEGILSEAAPMALPAGLLFVTREGHDSLDHPAAKPIADAWKDHGNLITAGDELQTYLRTGFFAYHKRLYENRPIYFPLSSAKKNFVAFAAIHRWQDDTLNALLADHLVPTRRRLEGELDDLRVARVSSSAKATDKRRAERRLTDVQRLLEELNDFIARVTIVAEQGPSPPDAQTPAREVDARFSMDLDDGVMVNSAALWPLLEAQWKEPKKWWKELATAQGKKDYDWSHLAARYFPARVRQKCHEDPSLAVAHKCFWELHPAKAFAWELRLQDEIRSDFTLNEPKADTFRARFCADHPQQVAELRAAEDKRRARKAAKAGQEGDEAETPTLFDDPEDTDADPDEAGG